MDKQTLRTYVIVISFIAVSALLFAVMRPFLEPLALAAIFAIVLYPVYLRLLVVTRNRRGIAALLSTLIATVCVLIPLTVLGALVLREGEQVYLSLVYGNKLAYAQVLEHAIHSVLGRYPGSEQLLSQFITNLDAYAQQALAWLFSRTSVIFGALAALFLDTFIFFIALFYFLRDGESLMKLLFRISPLRNTDDVTLVKRLSLAVNSIVKGSFFVALAQGAAASIGFIVFGVPNAILWGMITAVASLVPGIGTWLVLAPATVYAYAFIGPWHALALFLWGLIVVGTIDNIIRPIVVGRDLNIHPFLVLLAVLGGVALFGPSGIFLGPLAVSLFFALGSLVGEVSMRADRGT